MVGISMLFDRQGSEERDFVVVMMRLSCFGVVQWGGAASAPR